MECHKAQYQALCFSPCLCFPLERLSLDLTVTPMTQFWISPQLEETQISKLTECIKNIKYEMVGNFPALDSFFELNSVIYHTAVLLAHVKLFFKCVTIH